MAESASVWVSVVPSLRGFGAKLRAGLKAENLGITVTVGADTKAADAKLGETTRDRRTKVTAEADTKTADAKLGATDRKASGLDGRKVALDVTANTAQAMASIAKVAVAANEIDGRTFSPKIALDSKGIVGGLGRVVSGLVSVGGAAAAASTKFAVFSMAGAAAVKTVGSLGPAVNAAVGAAGLLPAALLSGAATAGTLKIGLHGVGDAVKNAFDPTKAKQFNQAMAKLSPNAKATVLALQGLGGQFKALRMDVQDRLFAGMADTVRGLASSYLPMARDGFSAMAGSINAGVQSFAGWLRLPGQVGMLRAATDNVKSGFDILVRGAVVPTAGALTTLAAVGSARLPGIGYAIGGVAQQFAVFIQQVAASGQLDAFLDAATTQLGLLFQALGWLGQIFVSVFTAGANAGGNLLRTLVGITSATARFLQSAQGMSLLTMVFRASNQAMAAAQPLLVAIGQALATTILPALAGALPAIGAAFGALAPAIAPLGQIIAALAPVLAVVAQVVAAVLTAALQALAPIVQALAPLFVAWAVSIGQGLVGAIQALAPLLLGLATFMGQHPALVLGVASAVGVLASGFMGLLKVVSLVATPLNMVMIGARLAGVSISSLLGPLWSGASAFGAWISTMFRTVGPTRLLGQGLMFIGRMILSSLGPVGALIGIFGTLFVTNEQFRGAVMGVVGALAGFIGQVVGALMPAFQALSPVLGTVSGVFGALAGGLATAVVPILNALTGIIQWLSPILAPLVAVILGIRAAVMAWSIAQGILNVVLAMNPVTLIVIAIVALVAAVVAAYQHFAWFRDIVNACWYGISTAAMAVWNGFLKPIFDAIGVAIGWVVDHWKLFATIFLVILGPIGIVIAAFTLFRDQTMAVLGAIGSFFSWVWTSILSPIFTALWTVIKFIGAILFTVLVAPFVIAWNIISAAAMAVWTAVLAPFFGWLGGILAAVGSWFVGLWTAYVVPAWNGITAAISFAWGVISAIFGAVMGFIYGVLAAAWNWLYTSVILPVWNGIVAAISFAWGVVSAIFGVIVGAIMGFLAAAWNFLWTGIIVPVWNGIVAAIQFAWGIIQAIWGALVAYIFGPLGAVFSWLWNSLIVPVWNGIVAAIQFAWGIIRGIFDVLMGAVHAVGDAFQAVADWIGRAWDTIRESARRPVQWVVDVVYNNGIRPVWNGIAGLFGLGQLGPVNLAVGGVLDGYAPGVDSVPAMLSRGEGVLVPEAVRGLGPGFVGWANRFFSRGRSDGGVGTGQGYSRGGVVAHFDGGGILGGIGDFLGGVGDFFMKVFTDPVGAVRDLFGKVVGDSNANPGGPTFGPGDGKGEWVKGLQAIPGKVIDAVIAKAKEWLASLASAGGGGPFDQWIAAALAILRWPMSYMAGIHQQIMTESGGNPGAVQHGYTDINTITGNLARGIMQVIPPTFARWALPGHGNIMNPVDNIIAGSRYAMAKYGAGWFAPGPWHSHGYDAGGLASGAGLLLKQTIAPERVLSPRQTVAFESLVPLLSQLSTRAQAAYAPADYGPGGHGGPGVVQHIYPREHMDEQQVADAAMRRWNFAARLG